MHADYETLVAEAIHTLVEIIPSIASAEIVSRFKNVSVQDKGLVGGIREIATEADVLTSERLLAALRPRFPGSFSEEHLVEDRRSHPVVIEIDPVDGTDEYVAGDAEGFSLLAAVLRANRSEGGKSAGAQVSYEPVAGLVYLPMRDTMFVTAPKTGVHLGNKQVFEVLKIDRCGTSPTSRPVVPPLPANEIRLGYRSLHPSPRLFTFADQIGQLLGKSIRMVPTGGAGAMWAALLEGRADLIIHNRPNAKCWDTDPAQPLLAPLGGWITDLYGRTIPSNEVDPVNPHGFMASLSVPLADILSVGPEQTLCIEG